MERERSPNSLPQNVICVTMGSYWKCNASNRMYKLWWIEFQPPFHSFQLGIGCYTILYTFGLSVRAVSISTKWHVVCFRPVSLTLDGWWICVYVYNKSDMCTFRITILHTFTCPSTSSSWRQIVCNIILYASQFFSSQCINGTRSRIGLADGWREARENTRIHTRLACASRKQIIRTLASLIINSMNYLEFSDKSKCIRNGSVQQSKWKKKISDWIVIVNERQQAKRRRRRMRGGYKSNMYTQNNCQIHLFTFIFVCALVSCTPLDWTIYSIFMNGSFAFVFFIWHFKYSRSGRFGLWMLCWRFFVDRFFMDE